MYGSLEIGVSATFPDDSMAVVKGQLLPFLEQSSFNLCQILYRWILACHVPNVVIAFLWIDVVLCCHP